jgi:intein/homing endonuclease
MSPYQLSITLHLVEDLEYGKFVVTLIHRLFGVRPSVYIRKDMNVCHIALSRRRSVEYLSSLGLVIGNKVKQQIRIPSWILDNEEYSLACMRGLMDTDGSVYLHTYKVGGKTYRYKKLSFSSASAPLRADVQFILHRFGSAATCSGTNVRIDAIKDVERYMRVIGSHNPKHLKRYAK